MLVYSRSSHGLVVAVGTLIQSFCGLIDLAKEGS